MNTTSEPLTEDKIGTYRCNSEVACEHERVEIEDVASAVQGLQNDISRWCCEKADHVNIGCDRCKVERERLDSLVLKWFPAVVKND